MKHTKRLKKMFRDYKCRNFSAPFKRKVNLILLLMLGSIILQCSPGEKNTTMKINWGSLPDIPPTTGQQEQKGLAGALAGVSSGMLIVAGGSNFPDSFPWQGGTKTYYNDIFVFNLNEKDEAWQVAGNKLPQPLAYSACVSVNDAVICIGGENVNGPVSDVLKLNFDQGEVQISSLPDFPVTVSNGGAATIGSVVYVVGGSGKDGNISSLYCADVAKADFEWEALPDMPGPLSNAVVVSQNDGNEDCIYVLGGRNRDGELSTFFSSVLKYSPSKKTWELVGDIAQDQNNPITLAAGTGAAVGENHILLFGGDNGKLFNKTEAFLNAVAAAETPGEKAEINSQKIKHLESHPGFSQQVFLYNTLSNECRETATLPFPAQVTTLTVNSGNRIFIPNGEIRPGVRTPKVTFAEISVNE
jgi:cyclically-permuted mutarotase family protein